MNTEAAVSLLDLRRMRVNRGLTLKGAADEMGLPDWKVLQRAERGHSVPSPPNAYKIASFFGVQVTDVWPVTEEAA